MRRTPTKENVTRSREPMAQRYAWGAESIAGVGSIRDLILKLEAQWTEIRAWDFRVEWWQPVQAPPEEAPREEVVVATVGSDSQGKP